MEDKNKHRQVHVHVLVQKSWVSPISWYFALTVKAIPKNYLKQWWKKKNCLSSSLYTVNFCPLYFTIFPCMFAHASINNCTHFSFFYQNIKKWGVARDFISTIHQAKGKSHRVRPSTHVNNSFAPSFNTGISAVYQQKQFETTKPP